MNLNSLFLIVQAPIKRENGKIYLEQGVFIGIEKWAENFNSIILGCPILKDEKNVSLSIVWKDMDELSCKNRIEIIEFEMVHRVLTGIKKYLGFRKNIREAIDKSQYLCFAGGGHKGDWGTYAALEAILKKRKYAAWTDRVEYNVLYENVKNDPVLVKWKRIIFDYFLLKFTFKFFVKKSEVALLHGNDCLTELKKIAKNGFLVHNIHISSEWKIKENEIENKLKQIDEGKIIEISYAGRTTYEKGLFDWIEIATRVAKKYPNVEFNWYGDGEELEKAREIIAQSNLSEKVKFHGFVGNKEMLLNSIKNSAIFMFCHKTKESPRNLIESLIVGTPIVGYYSEYPEDLISENRGGVLSEKNDTNKLAENIETLMDDKDKLKNLIRRAADDGKNFDIAEVFKHRSDLIKKYL